MATFFRHRSSGQEPASTAVTDRALVKRFLRDPDFPRLISFPRTGSHWLRVVMELYFEKPSLQRIFFLHGAKDFTCFHWHDTDLTMVGVNSVLYLYRHPVDTIFSQMRYLKANPFDPDLALQWTNTYARHLSKWLFDETFTVQKTIITYEGLQSDAAAEFKKVVAHFGASLEQPRFEAALGKASKGRIHSLTPHDRQVIDLSQDYELQKEEFRARLGPQLMAQIALIDERLPSIWTPLG
jgi:hypothetical protein